jgi:hypothetical protein
MSARFGRALLALLKNSEQAKRQELWRGNKLNELTRVCEVSHKLVIRIKLGSGVNHHRSYETRSKRSQVAFCETSVHCVYERHRALLEFESVQWNIQVAGS